MARAREPIPPTIEWRRGRVRLLDQRALPQRVQFLDCTTVKELVDAIRSLAVRGAPALGAAGAYGVALAAATVATASGVRAAATRVARARPTAVNLAWGVERGLAAFAAGGAAAALAEARAIAAADVAANRALGGFGAPLLGDGARVLTHCNTGSLATVGYGTALGVIRAAAESGTALHVWVDETRPLLQGARLTAWELDRLGIPYTVVADVMAGSLLATGDVDAVIVGADRIAANGDVANKIGTYSLAVLAHHHRVPFYVAAPTTTVDLRTPDGDAIAIEERDADEVLHFASVRTTPRRARAANRAFDVTPSSLVTAIVTERGVAHRPLRRSLRALVAAGEGAHGVRYGAATPRP
jgi:methylthioribose-1-phosphate isomerase